VAVASAGPCANLHLAQADNHASTPTLGVTKQRTAHTVRTACAVTDRECHETLHRVHRAHRVMKQLLRRVTKYRTALTALK